MEINITTPAGVEGAVNVSDVAFAREFNEGLVHQVVTAYQAAARQGTKAQKGRSDVSGGGKKPWRQKGSGRARAGTIRSPLWRSGGVTFAAQPRSYEQKVNRKMYRAALQCIFSELARQDRLIVVENVALEKPKTQELVKLLAQYDLNNVLVVSDQVAENLYLASRNLRSVDVVDVCAVNPVGLIRFEKVMLTVAALKKIEEMLS